MELVFLGKLVPIEDVEELIRLADETGVWLDETFQCELAQMKYKDKVAEIRGKELTEFELPLRIDDFYVGMNIVMLQKSDLFYYPPAINVGDRLEVVELVRDGGRYDRIIVKKAVGDTERVFAFMLFDQDKFEIVD